jgi:hypothetical protein
MVDGVLQDQIYHHQGYRHAYGTRRLGGVWLPRPRAKRRQEASPRDPFDESAALADQLAELVGAHLDVLAVVVESVTRRQDVAVLSRTICG